MVSSAAKRAAVGRPYRRFECGLTNGRGRLMVNRNLPDKNSSLAFRKLPDSNLFVKHQRCFRKICSISEIAPELTGHGLPLSKCEAYNRGC